MSTTSSRNFTTLYSGAGSVVPQGAYGNANVVSLLNVGTDGGNTVGNIVATGNITAASIGNGLANISFSPVAGGPITFNVGPGPYDPQMTINDGFAPDATVVIRNTLEVLDEITVPNLTSDFIVNSGNVTTGGFFIGNVIGNVIGNISGNILAAGANTQVQFNDNTFLGATAGFTFNKTSNVLAVTGNITGGNVAGTIVSASGNVVAGNVTTGGLISATGNTTSGNFVTAGNLFGNVVATTVSGIGVANLDIIQNGPSTGTTVLNLSANVVVAGRSGTPATITGPFNTSLSLSTNQNGSPQPRITLQATGNIDIGPAGSGAAAIALAGNTYVGFGTARGNLIVANAVYVGESISATGNITANASSFFIGNGSQLTGIVSSYGNANVANFLGNGFGSNTITTTGNITSGNSTVTDTLYVSNIEGAAGQNVTITADGTGDIHLDADSIRIGDNNTAATVVTHGTGNLILRTHEGSAVEGNITLVNGVNGNIQLNPNGTGVVTTTAVSATGNINGANLVASANLTSTQQTVVGTANNGSTGNIVVSGKNIATDMAWLPDGGNAATAVNGRIVVGTGWNGNISHSARQNRLLVQDAFVRSNTTTNTQQFASDAIVSLTGNVTNNSFRVQAVGARVQIGGGPAGNTMSGAFGVGSVGTIAALQPNIDVGNASPYNLGNIVVSQAVLNGGFFTINPGSTLTNAYGMIPGVNSNGAGANVTNYIGFASQLQGYGVGSVTGNVYGVYHGNSSSINTTGIGVANVVRSAPGYYAFYNADDVAQVQLGSLRSYNEFEFATATSGPVNINKLNAQVQFLNPTANVTIGDFQNFVSVANDGTNNDLQTDTVTLIVQQGATPYTVTMPTGNAAIKYLGGTTTVGSTANAVSVVTIRAIKSLGNATGSTLYLTAISSEYT